MKYLFFILLFWYSLFAYSQEKKDYDYSDVPLVDVIQDIEAKNDLVFSFANDIITGKHISLNAEQITLTELLSILEEQTGLVFKRVDEKQLAILPEETDTSGTQELKEVVVTGYITSGIDRKTDGSISINQKSLGILPGLTTPDILQSIQLVPGIRSLDESASGIQIRGGSPDQNLILYDGIKLYHSGYLFGMFSAFNPYAIEKARIFKSGTSAVYGDRISGILDISSGTEIPKKTTGGFGLDGLSADGYIKTALKENLALYFFARRSYTDFFKSPTYDSYAEKLFSNGGIVKDRNGNVLNVISDDEYTEDTSENDFSFYDINFKTIYSPTKKDRFTLSSLHTRNTLDFSFPGDGEAKLDSLVTKNNGISLGWERLTPEGKKGEINAYFSRYNSYYKNKEVFGTVLEETNVRDNEITDLGIDFRTYGTINEHQSYTLGYQISHTKVGLDLRKEFPASPGRNVSLPSDGTNLKNAFFGEYTYSLDNLAHIRAGLRLVHYSSVGKLLLEPRLNFEYPVTKSIRAKAALERRNQPISQLIEFNQTELRLENNSWQLSDDLTYPLLQSNQVSGGILFSNNGFTLDIDGYLKKLTGLTSYTNGFSTPFAELSEGKSEIIGVDVLLKKLIGNYRVWAGYSFNDIVYNFSEIQEDDFRGNNGITHSFKISNSLKVNDFQFALGWQYRTGEPFSPINTFDPLTAQVEFGTINSARLRDYHRLDASVIYNFNIASTTKAQLGVSALNLYDRKIPISIIYRTQEVDDQLELRQVIQRQSLGLTPNMVFRVFF